MAKRRPGVIVYFDIRSAMKRLSQEQKGYLLDAILDYGEFGVNPDLPSDPFLQLAWDFIRPRIDSDGEAYAKKVGSNFYGTYCREAKKNNVEPIPFDIWNGLSEDAQRKVYSNLSNDIV